MEDNQQHMQMLNHGMSLAQEAALHLKRFGDSELVASIVAQPELIVAALMSLLVSIVTVRVLLYPLLKSLVEGAPASVARKKLPTRPVLKIHFLPDEPQQQQQQQQLQQPAERGVARQLFSVSKRSRGGTSQDGNDTDLDDEEDEILLKPRETDAASQTHDETVVVEDDLSDDEEDDDATPEPFVVDMDLPDSFAPLLSSSHVEIPKSNLTPDLIHGLSVNASVLLRQGRHEIPLNKDPTRPQFILDVVPEAGCRVSVESNVGSDGFSVEDDLDPTLPTTKRTKPIVKSLSISVDPPLPMANVAPTLIHFPTLFEDKLVPRLRRVSALRFLIDFVISISSYLERCLWLVEKYCQIHLAKAQMTLVYKGFAGSTPKWRLAPAFSGHVLVFGWIPVPFVSIVLPTFIIPHPHALLDFLMSKQPLASAKIKREKIDEEKIAIAALEPLERWTAEVKLLSTPPALGVDVTLPGGLSVSVDSTLGRDPAARSRSVSASTASSARQAPMRMNSAVPSPRQQPLTSSSNSLSSWSTNQQATDSPLVDEEPADYDANNEAPWLIEFKAKGSCSHEKLAFHLLKLQVSRGSAETGGTDEKSQTGEVNNDTSQFSTSGSFAVWKVPLEEAAARAATLPGPSPLRRNSSWNKLMNKRSGSVLAGRPPLDTGDSPSVAAILLFPEETTSFHHYLRLLQYDYALEVSQESKLDALTLCIGATHPMLKGGTTITMILDSIFGFGSLMARDGAIVDPMERKRKRNILRHLPVCDLSCGVQNIFIPKESKSYSDDGQTLFLPELEGGRMMLRFLGGMEKQNGKAEPASTSEGIIVKADFEVAMFNLNTEGDCVEFPELEVYEGTKIKTNLLGSLNGVVKSHLRPQPISADISTAGPNLTNPLEAYEIDFSDTNLSVKMREYAAVVGHRRIILPAESAFVVKVMESVVDMTFEGNTICELSWDFQGLSPILQVAQIGESPEDAQPESKEQVALLIAPLRQGRFSFQVSSVGGIQVKKAATSRDHKEGLYDWKFFNALVSPDESSAQRILDVLHDRRSMTKLLQVAKLLNKEVHGIMDYSLRQIWRAKEILDAEGVTEPGHVIPMFQMARMVSLFLTGDAQETTIVLPLIRRVVEGDGLDVVAVKDLLRKHLPQFDDWAPEIDRGLRWGAILTGPMVIAPNVAGQDVTPLAQVTSHSERFKDIPTASQLYKTIMEKPQLPLEPTFSNLVGRVAPYLSFQQIKFILEARSSTDWQQTDLRRLRYVYAIKKKVLEIAESYGGFSFLPQSFLVSVFLGEATKASLKVSRPKRRNPAAETLSTQGSKSGSFRLRKRRVLNHLEDIDADFILSPAQKVASFRETSDQTSLLEKEIYLEYDVDDGLPESSSYEMGDSLLGPQDVAILLQSGLTSVMKSSTVVQLNQRMLLDLISSQPRSFAVAVLAEIGSPSGEGSPRGLTSALMSLLELDQTAFQDRSRIDMHALLESWLPGLKVPVRQDYMAGGRWARQSYYEAIFSIATSILEDAESYMALKGHLQRVRHNRESDPIPGPTGERMNDDDSYETHMDDGQTKVYSDAVEDAKGKIATADEYGHALLEALVNGGADVKSTDEYQQAVECYHQAFKSCSSLLKLDRYAFQLTWFKEFYQRNYDALMIKSLFDNVVDDVDQVRRWLQALRNGPVEDLPEELDGKDMARDLDADLAPDLNDDDSANSDEWEALDAPMAGDGFFLQPELVGEQTLVDGIIDALIYLEEDRERLRNDPLTRLLIPNPPGFYNFAIVSAMGVITEGERGLELKDAFERLEFERGVISVRSGTATARSLEYNASKIEEAVQFVSKLKKPFGLLGYSQGCANALMAETLMNSGSPTQHRMLDGLVCRQLMFSAANGSVHGPATERKVQRLIVLCEEFFKYQQGYVSRALASAVIGMITNILDSSHFHKAMGGAQSFLPDGCKSFWREAQHLGHVPTCTLRGVLEKGTTPESLEMISNLLTKQSGSNLHDSQVHAYDAVGHPIYHRNRNGRILERCDVGTGALQRTHHWSPLSDEVEFVRTKKDVAQATFECAKDRHVFPWVEVNARFGIIPRMNDQEELSQGQGEIRAKLGV